MDLTPPQKPPSITSADPVDDLGKQRELRVLRQQKAQLEAELKELRNGIKPSISTIEQHEEAKHRISTCGFHPQVLVSMETNSVVCATCGVELSPLDVLREFAREERRFAHGLNSLRDEKKKLDSEVGKLRKQLQTLKSKTRKAVGYDPKEHESYAKKDLARMYYDLLAENARLREQLKAQVAS